MHENVQLKDDKVLHKARKNRLTCNTQKEEQKNTFDISGFGGVTGRSQSLYKLRGKKQGRIIGDLQEKTVYLNCVSRGLKNNEIHENVLCMHYPCKRRSDFLE